MGSSIVGPRVVLVPLVKKKICQGSSKSGIFVERYLNITFLAILLSMVIDT